MADTHSVLIVGEVTDGQLDDTTKELLAHGRQVADDLQGQLAVAILGTSFGQLPEEAIALGADKVYAVTDPLLQEYQVDAYTEAITNLAREQTPAVILLGKTSMGSEVGPRVAFRLDTGLAQDCLELRVDSADKRLIATRPVFGGSCIATVSCSSEPMMAVLRSKTLEPLTPDSNRQGEVVAVNCNLDASILKNKLVERVEEAQEGLQLEDARIVVSGGRGLGGPEPFFGELQELADILGAAVGATRAVVDVGWVPYSYQVGLTGKTITPDLYITVGISGASQHMAGCTGSKVIVAINKDSEANIFQEARYGVAGDWKTVLPAFVQQLREIL